MKRIFIPLAGLIFLVFTNASHALVAGPAKISGKVRSFDKSVLVVENDGHRYEVPREFVAEKDLTANKDIEVLLTEDQLKKVKIQDKKAKK